MVEAAVGGLVVLDWLKTMVVLGGGALGERDDVTPETVVIGSLCLGR
ncbi:hypothetical protein Hanom_Chr15g01400361 [Helianthus anomalus]